MSKIYKENLTNDSTQKVLFLSKLPGNLGDLIMKDLDIQGKKIEQIYWIDLLIRCQEKVKYICWKNKAQDFTPSVEVCRLFLPRTTFKKIKSKRYGRFKPK